MVMPLLAAAAAAAAPTRRNVLFLICDDLRPQLNKAYGQSFMHTPNFDKLAETSVTFDFAFTNFGICSASRNSFMSGRQPDNTRTWNFIDHFRSGGVDKTGAPGSEWVTFPEYFKDNGYSVYGHGKLYHPNHPPNNDEPMSWSQDQQYYGLSTKGCPKDLSKSFVRYCPGESNDNSSYSDYGMVTNALATLRKAGAAFKANGTNFWIGVGNHFPHQPWYTPKWAEDAYPGIENLPGPKHPYAPKGCPDVAFTAELDGKVELPLNEDMAGFASSRPAGVSGVVEYDCPSPGNNTLPPYFQQQLRMGYYSAVTLSDYNMGRVLDLLDELDLVSSTAVVLTGDHGWQLGEHAEWGKHTNWELAVQVPLLIRAPWLPSAAGAHTQTYAELLDLYRTLSSLAGLPEPPAGVDGTDLSAAVADPAKVLKQEAYAQYSRCPGDRQWPTRQPGHPDWYLNNCEKVPATNISYMGYSVRTAEWRYTEWLRWDGARCAADFAATRGRELYSHKGQVGHPLDFDAWENENVAEDPANAGAVQSMRALLLARFETNASLGCPGSAPAPAPSPGPAPLQQRALQQLRSTDAGHWDSSLCATEECLSKQGNKYGYAVVATEGYMPAEGTEMTVPLYQYWDGKTADNYLTTAPAPEGYKTPADLNPAGRVFATKPGWLSGVDTVPLQVWYSAERGDHLTCALPSSVAWAQQNNYTLLSADIGHVYTTPQPDAALEAF